MPPPIAMPTPISHPDTLPPSAVTFALIQFVALNVALDAAASGQLDIPVIVGRWTDERLYISRANPVRNQSGVRKIA